MTEQQTQQTATPENPSARDADFEATVSTPAVEEKPKQEKPTEEQSSEEDNTDQNAAKKPKNGYKRTIEKLKGQISEKDEIIERMKSGSAAPQQAQTPPAKPTNLADGKPKAENFTTHEAWVEALTDWKADQKAAQKVDEEFKKRDDSNKQAEFQKKHAERVKAFDDQKVAAREVHPDFDEVLAQFDDVPVSSAIHGVLLTSDMGAEIAYYLANNPKEFEALNKNKDILGVNRALAKIEAKIEMSKPTSEAEDDTPVEVKKTTKAPEPITPVGAAKSRSVFDPNTADPDDYISHRWKERNRK